MADQENDIIQNFTFYEGERLYLNVTFGTCHETHLYIYQIVSNKIENRS